jgi:molybdopterin/thiamine biosynthesis adenylyltransferase
VADRQARIPGFSQAALSRITVACAGAGGIVSEIGCGLARKGVGHLCLCDPDTVEPSNLNRQRFFKADVGKSKAVKLAKNLASESFLGTVATGVPVSFMEAVGEKMLPTFDCIVSGIDDEIAREEIAEYALSVDKPLVTAAVSLDGDGGYVQIQKPGEACWGCALVRPRRLRDDLANCRAPCPGSPAIKDILMLVGGAAFYAIDALFMKCPISWNYREVHLAGFMPDVSRMDQRRSNCQLCGNSVD